jgi:AcrR family transcriptional regulator
MGEPHPNADSECRRRRKEARPGELIDAALAEFATHGYAATRLEDIAARAGVTKGTIYLYFADKEALFEAVVRATVVPLITETAARVRDHDGSARDLLRDTIGGWRAALALPGIAVVPKLVMTEAANFPAVAAFYYDNVVEPGRRAIRALIERGIERGEFRAVDPAVFVHFVIGPFIYAHCFDSSFGDVRPGARILDDRFFEELFEHVLRSLSPR